MKKILISLLIVMSLLSVVSCNPDKTSSDTYDIPLPVFGEADSSGRGLMEMPTAYFEGDHFLSCSVMTTMPTMTNLEAKRISLSKSSLGTIDANYTVFGFKIKLEEDYSRINDDGVYLQYSIWDDDSVVGFCDYYYNIKKRTFSYRQSVACSFDESINNIPITDNEVLNLEYIDVPVENALVPEFSVGQLTDDGVLDDNAFVDQISFREDKIGDQKWVYERGYITANEVKEGRYYTIYSMKQPDHYLITDSTSYEEFPALKNLVYSKIYDENKKIIRKNINIDFMLELYPLFYENGESIRDHHSTVKGYESYEEFTGDSFSSLTDPIKSKSGDSEKLPNAPRPTIYTYKGTASTGASTNRNSMIGKGKTSFFSCLYVPDEDKYNDERYKELGFEQYLGTYNKDAGYDIREYTIRKFLEKCGIKNESYIKAFIENDTKLEDGNKKLTERIRATSD